MTLKEAIKRYTSNAEYERTHGNLQGCLDFKQLAEWLKELKQLREQEPFDIETYCKEHFCVMVDKDVWEKAEKALKQEPILDKIKDEIMQLYNEVEVVDYDRKDISRIKTAHWIIREEVLWIIDKYNYNSCPKRGANMRKGE